MVVLSVVGGVVGTPRHARIYIFVAAAVALCSCSRRLGTARNYTTNTITMSCLCIGGVCIPYTAVLPFLMAALHYIATKLAHLGLLPTFVAKRLGVNPSTGKKIKGDDDCCSSSDDCCKGDDKESSGRMAKEWNALKEDRYAKLRKKWLSGNSDARTVSTATSTTTSGEDDSSSYIDNNDPTEVEHIDTREHWQKIFIATRESTLFVKFTAEWCKPCKAIQPSYVAAASKFGCKGTKFVTLDVDGEECNVISDALNVAMMPTFVCLKDGVEAGRMSGGNSGEKLNDWVTEMCS